MWFLNNRTNADTLSKPVYCLIAAPSSTKNTAGKRDEAMHQSKKGNQYYFGGKVHIGVDEGPAGLVHTVDFTAGNVADITQTHQRLHGAEDHLIGDAGYIGLEKRSEMQGKAITCLISPRPGTLRKLTALGGGSGRPLSSHLPSNRQSAVKSRTRIP